MKRILLAFAVVALGVCNSAQAGVDIRIDLSNLVSLTAGNWNNIGNLTGLTPNLIDFNTGLGTGVAIDGNNGPWRDFFGDDNGTFPNQGFLVQPATEDGAGLDNGQTGVYTFTGLAGSSYKIEVVSARTEFDYLNTITVNGAIAGSTFLNTPVVTPWGSTTDGLNPGNWLIWDNVVPVNGVINLMDIASQNTLGIINAVHIVEVSGVPEPATILLPAISMVGLFAVRVRRALGK